VAEMLLDKLGILDSYEITISFSRNIPVGKGLSSSTADMLSTIRALQEIFGFLLREKTISEIFTSIEPHDGLMFKSCVVYDHRKGELIMELLYIPEFWVVAIDFGGVVDTVSYNKNLLFTDSITRQYEELLLKLENSFNLMDDKMIAECASESTYIHLSMHNNAERLKVFEECKQFNPMGVINTHSGTCLGLLFSKKIEKAEIMKIADSVNSHFQYPVFVTSTLKLLI
jgi:L-threonine kinase